MPPSAFLMRDRNLLWLCKGTRRTAADWRPGVAEKEHLPVAGCKSCHAGWGRGWVFPTSNTHPPFLVTAHSQMLWMSRTSGIRREFPHPLPFCLMQREHCKHPLGVPTSPSSSFLHAPCAWGLILRDPSVYRSSGKPDLSLGSRPTFTLTLICFSLSRRLQKPSRRERRKNADSSVPPLNSGKSHGSAKPKSVWLLERGRVGERGLCRVPLRRWTVLNARL